MFRNGKLLHVELFRNFRNYFRNFLNRSVHDTFSKYIAALSAL